MKNNIVLIILLFSLAFGFYIYKVKSNNIIESVNQNETEETIIEKYISNNLLKPEFGGKVFCVFHNYSLEKNETENNYYLWIYCEEYYKKDNKVLMGSGVSMPVKLETKKVNGAIEILNYQKPQDGEDYAKSIKEMFPDKFENLAINGFDITQFPVSPKQKADIYFGI